MKLLKQGAFLAVLAALAASSASVSAIEGLQISVQCPDVILGWPSVAGENYIVQWRPTLAPSTPWVTLTNSLPADWTTNWTTFVHSNQVQCSSGGTNGFSGGGSELPPTPSSAALSASAFWASQPMVRRADGSGSTVPLCIYPPGIDLSPFIIFDPSTGDWVSGSGYTISQPSLNRLRPDGPQPNDPDPQDGPPPPDPGFYQVVKDGVRIWGLTNLTGGVVLSNTVNIAFEAGNADPNNGTNLIGTLTGAVLLVDGAKFAGNGVLSAQPWQFAMDTAYLENGDHTLQVEAFWYDPNGPDDGTESLYPSRYSDPITITVLNAIYYPQWEEDIGEAATNAAYFLKTTCTDADWSIDIYDVNTNFVQRLTGHTDDGTIEAYWNLVDTNGISRTNADVDPEFSATITVADPITKKTPPKKMPKNDWPEHAKWTVAYQDYFRHYYSPSGDMQGHINYFALTAADFGGYYLYYPQPGQTNDIGQTFPLRYRNPDHPADNVTAGMITKDYNYLKAYLGDANSRNFFFRGHGNPTQIGDISSAEIKAAVGKHRYRFVLLQACESADGDLDKAFGINGPGQFDIPYYQKSGKRPAAFMGNHGKSRFANPGKETINGVDYDGRIPWQVPYLYYEFLFYWDPYDMGWDLFSSMGQAILDLPAIQGWSYEDHPGRRLKIYGYPFLYIDQYNYRADWSQ
ncbi:MAG: hypothetical protein WCK27_13280 [Verrucomicrobiota bacterium]